MRIWGLRSQTQTQEHYTRNTELSTRTSQALYANKDVFYDEKVEQKQALREHAHTSLPSSQNLEVQGQRQLLPKLGEAKVVPMD
jgi:hypothetical protein